MRRETNKSLRQELDKYSDERMARFQHKMTAFDVTQLSKVGFREPRRELIKMRARAEKIAQAEEL